MVVSDAWPNVSRPGGVRRDGDVHARRIGGVRLGGEQRRIRGNGGVGVAVQEGADLDVDWRGDERDREREAVLAVGDEHGVEPERSQPRAKRRRGEAHAIEIRRVLQEHSRESEAVRVARRGRQP